jgi:hypothetical protein
MTREVEVLNSVRCIAEDDGRIRNTVTNLVVIRARLEVQQALAFCDDAAYLDARRCIVDIDK